MNDFKTSDLAFAAYLLTTGYKISKTEREGPRVLFVFETEAAKIESLKVPFFDGTTQVAAYPFAASIKRLKGLVHSS